MSRLITIDKNDYKKWLEFCEQVQNATIINLLETPKQKSDRIEMLKGDYGAFFEYYFPHYAKKPTAKFHVKFANRVMRQSNIRAVWEAFRGSAKSTHATIGIPFWLMVNDQMKFMALVGENETKAALLLSCIQAELENNQRIINDYGLQVRQGNWEDGSFVTKGNVAFHCIGLGQSPRGLRNGQNRPDYICVDDIDTKERCKNPKRVREAVEWVKDDLMGCFDEGNQRFVFCNNRIHKSSVLAQLALELKPAKNFYHMIVNAVDGYGNPTWPEKYTKQYWKELFDERGYRSSQREYMNNPIEEGTVFKNEWIRFGKILPLHKYESLVMYCDPSFKSGSKADYKAVVLLGKIGNQIHVLDCFVRQSTIVDMVQWFYDWHEKVVDLGVIIDYYMEANFIQDLLADEFRLEGEKRGYQLPLRGDKRAKPDKFQRIESLSPLFERSFILFNERIKDTLDMRKLVEQFLSFEKGSRTADDGPDAVEGGVFIIQRQGRMSNAKHRIGKRQKKTKY